MVGLAIGAWYPPSLDTEGIQGSQLTGVRPKTQQWGVYPFIAVGDGNIVAGEGQTFEKGEKTDEIEDMRKWKGERNDTMRLEGSREFAVWEKRDDPEGRPGEVQSQTLNARAALDPTILLPNSQSDFNRHGVSVIRRIRECPLPSPLVRNLISAK